VEDDGDLLADLLHVGRGETEAGEGEVTGDDDELVDDAGLGLEEGLKQLWNDTLA